MRKELLSSIARTKEAANGFHTHRRGEENNDVFNPLTVDEPFPPVLYEVCPSPNSCESVLLAKVEPPNARFQFLFLK